MTSLIASGGRRTCALVIPAFDEERRLPRLFDRLRDARRVFADRGLELVDVVVVDDGSTDRTPVLLADQAGLRTIRLERNRGKGFAVREGVMTTNADLVLVSDVDLASPLEEVGDLLDAIDAGAEVAIGSRGLSSARVIVHQPRHRELMGKLFNRIVRTFTGLPFRDTQCGFKLFTRTAARSLFGDLSTTGFAFDVEVLAKARRDGLAVAEVPVTWADQDGTTVSLVGSSSRMLRDVVAIAMAFGSKRAVSRVVALGRVVILGGSTLLLFALTPHAGAVTDGLRYEQIAEAPWSNAVGTPWALRIGIPLLARGLPFALRTSFYLLAVLSVFGTALLVAAIGSQLGLPERHALAGGVLATWTSLSVTCFWTYYVDVHVVLLIAATVYLTARGRTRFLPLLIGAGVLVKEVAVLAGPLVGFVGGRRKSVTAAIATGLGIAVYSVLVGVLPAHGNVHQGGVLHAQLQDIRVWFDALRRIGVAKYTANAVLSTFGLTWLLWLSGFRAAGGWLRWSLWWIPVTLPILMTTQWERTFAFYVPLLVPLALLAIPRMSLGALVLFTSANAWVAGGVETRTVGDDAVTPALHKLLLMSPGLALACAVLLVAWRGARSPGFSRAPLASSPTR